MTEENRTVSGDINEQLKRLTEPFPAGDIEWRVMRSMPWGQNIRCIVFPYVTARAIHERLDDVVGPANWCNTQQAVNTVAHTRDGKPVLSVQVGISIRIGNEWVTKYNVSEATDVEPAKGAFSGAEKRSGGEWGIGRYLYFLGEMDADTTRVEPPKGTGWTFGQLSEKYGREKFWWKPPQMPAWALPADAGAEQLVTADELNNLKLYWSRKLAPNEKNRATKQAMFFQLVTSMFGPFPVDQPAGWTHDMISQVRARIDEAVTGSGGGSVVPFQ